MRSTITMLLAMLFAPACSEPEQSSPVEEPPASRVPAIDLSDLGGYDSAAFDTDTEKTWPKTLPQAVAVILHGMDEESRELVRSKSREELSDFHHGWGTGIRNSLGLWRGNDELIWDCREGEPDGASAVIIKAVWQALQEQKAR